MSREGLADFVYAAEHSSSLRREIRKCENSESLIKLAKKNGFSISTTDLLNSDQCDKIEEWFKNSKIHPIQN